MASLSPQSPIQADHRFLMKFIGVSLGGKVEIIPSELDRVSRVFSRMGGSWERIFKGSPKDVTLMKRILKAAAKHGYLTKKESWS